MEVAEIFNLSTNYAGANTNIVDDNKMIYSDIEVDTYVFPNMDDSSNDEGEDIVNEKDMQITRRSTMSTTVSSASYSASEGLSDEALDIALEDPNIMEKILEREMYEMKPEEREAAINELHGVEFGRWGGYSENNIRNLNETTKECPEMTALALRDMQNILDELVPPCSISPMNDEDEAHNRRRGNRRYHAYRRGLELKSDFIRTEEYRLKFLRADRFDARKAAIRYCECLDLLLKCFGEKIFRRQLYMSDLTALELKYFRDGNCQVLPSRDRIGRRVFVFIGRHDASTYEEYSSAFRLLVFLLWTILAEDVTTQVKGAVVLVFPTFEEPSMAKNSAKKMNQIITTIPVRYSALHFCIPNSPVFNLCRSLCLMLIGPEGRRVCRVHTGSPVEVDYVLSSYGINVKDIPRTYTFMVKTKNWARFAKVRTAIDNFRKKTDNEAAGLEGKNEESIEEVCGVECPEVNCILFGNKAMAWDHPGNIEFRDLIEEKELERELHPKRFLKGDRYNDYIIEEGRLRNFVYMEYDKKNLWYTEIVDDDVLRHKITQLLTGIRKRRKATRMAQKLRSLAPTEPTPISTNVEETVYQGNRCTFLCAFNSNNDTVK